MIRVQATLPITLRHGIMSLRTALGPGTHHGAVLAACWRGRLSYRDRPRAQPAPRCASNRAVPSASMPGLVASRGIITASPSGVAAAPLSHACSAPGGRQTPSCSAAPAIVLASTEEGEAVGTTILSSVPDPPGLLYEALLALHSTTGLGWASTLIAATIIMRLSLLPLSLYADRNSRKFHAMVTPALLKLYQDLSPVDNLGRPRKFESKAEFWQLQYVAFDAVRKLWRRHQCSPLKTLASPLVQLPVFVSASVAIRRLCGPYYAELQSGGMLWFQDLTIAGMHGFMQVNWNHPEALLLPGLTTGLALLNAHLAFGDKLPLLKRAVMLLPVICLPLTYQLPQALFCYWSTSFAFTTAQILCQRTSLYQKLVQPQLQTAPTQPRITLEEADAAAAPPLGGSAAASKLVQAGKQAKAENGHEVEDLNQRIQRAQQMYKDKPEELQKAHMEILLQRMTYEREYVLPRILEEASLVDHQEGQEATLVDEDACRRVQDAIERARASGLIVALPPVVAELEEVADLGKGDGHGGKRIKLVFPQKT